MARPQRKILLSSGDKTMTATLAENEAAETLISLLEAGRITVEMSDYGGFEKVGTLPQTLPTSNTRITTKPGDIMLYQGNNIVIFYGSNTWSYTRLGKIDGVSEENLRQFLGSGKITLVLNLDPSAVADEVKDDSEDDGKVFNLQGALVSRRPLSPGFYIINGKKTLIK